MSEWIRHRGSKSMPKCLEGKRFEVRMRDGEVSELSSDTHGIRATYQWNHAGICSDVMAFRILGDINPPDHYKGFPVGTTAKDIGAKVGDEFEHIRDGEKYTLSCDDGSVAPIFTDSTGRDWSIAWDFLAPIQPKPAIELQAEEVGIPEPVRLVDSDGWIEWNGGECPVPYDALVEVKFRNGRTNANPADVQRWQDCTEPWSIIAYRVLDEWPEDRIDTIGRNGGDGLHYDADSTKHVTPAAVNVLVDLGVDAPTTAPDFLQSALNTLTQRGKDYDKPEGERSAAAVAVAFNAITGKDLTDAEVYLVLQLVKDVRQWQCADYHADSALDCVAYAALKAEALAGGEK